MAAEERGRVEDGVATHLAQVSWRPLVALTGSSYRLGPTVPCTHAPRAGLGRIRVCHGIRAPLVDVSKMVGGSQVASRHAAPGGDFIISSQAPSNDAPRSPRTCVGDFLRASGCIPMQTEGIRVSGAFFPSQWLPRKPISRDGGPILARGPEIRRLASRDKP